jgi:hypothetical protein
MDRPTPHRARRNHFTATEDVTLSSLVLVHGEDNWGIIAEQMPNRTRRQCSERWKHYLSPTVLKSRWTAEEDAELLRCFQQYGSQWKQLEVFFPGRKDNQLKNRHKLLVRRANKERLESSNSEIIESDAFVTELESEIEFGCENDYWMNFDSFIEAI